MTNWIYMKHPDLADGQRFPDDPAVVASQQARGWVLHSMPLVYDDDAVNTGAIVVTDEVLYASEPVLSEDEVEALKGKALDEALEAASLPKTGTVAQKRDRLAEYETGLAGSTTTESE